MPRSRAPVVRSHHPPRKHNNPHYTLTSYQEHFSTPLAFAHKHYGLEADLIPIGDGTGTLAKRLKTNDEDGKLDLAIGLTEGFVADLGRERAAGSDPGYNLVGTYVESPLCWGITTGAKRDDVKTVQDVKGRKVGVSRIGR